jgi:hypothetical protein
MKCECGTSCKDKTRMCWAKWGLCVKCAVKKHPEFYPKEFPVKYGIVKKPNPRPGIYKLCPECTEVMSKLRYWKNGTTPSLNSYYCVPCRIIVNFDDKIKFVMPVPVRLK